MDMTADDAAAIERYAGASVSDSSIGSLRTAAIEAHRRYLRDTPQGEWNLHMKFMSEVDSPCPDYSLRATYRARLLGKE